MLPRQGDKITAIDGKVYRAIVGHGGHGLASGYFRWHPASKRSSTRAYREDTEGLDWIRGWHEEGSNELNALLAAHKLAASAQTFPFDAFAAITVSSSLQRTYQPLPNPAFDFDPTR